MNIRKYSLAFDLPVDSPDYADIESVCVFLVRSGETASPSLGNNAPSATFHKADFSNLTAPTIEVDLTSLLSKYVTAGKLPKGDLFDILVYTTDAVGNYDSPEALTGVSFDITPPPRVVNLRLR